MKNQTKDKISLCENCNCMTKTTEGVCGKCGKLKKEKKMKLKLTGAFSMEFGTNGFVRGFNNKWVQLIVTNDGVYKDGILVAKGKLKLLK